MKILRFFAIGIVLCSCRDSTIEKEILGIKSNNSLINYYFSVKPFGEYHNLSFSFNYLRADQLGRMFRTVYLDPNRINIANGQQHRINLGSSTIEPLTIKGFSFGATQFYIHKGNEIIPLVMHDFIYVKTDLDLERQDTLEITFELDLSSSVVLDSAGVDWLIPQIKVVKE
jgi:hypothetical protein